MAYFPPVNITVIRGPGSKYGPDIFEAILSSEVAARFRGKMELNETNQGWVDRVITIPFTTGMKDGILVKVIDALQGKVYVGQVVSVSHAVRMDDVEAVTNLSLKVPEF